MRIHAITPSSFVNGPGNRAVIHFQGCTLGCSGCFNPSTHDKNAGEDLCVEEILSRIPASADGITISGGEPFLQPDALYELVSSLRPKFDSIIVFSGFYLHEIMNIVHGRDILKLIDVLIDGRFDHTKLASNGLRGSTNQTIHILTNRHTYNELIERNVEITINPNGDFIITGFPTTDLIQSIKGG